MTLVSNTSFYRVGESKEPIPLCALLVEHATSAVRACDESLLAEGDLVSAVAAEVGHGGAVLVAGDVVGGAAGDGGGGRDLVFFARHGCGMWCGFDLRMGGREA